MEVKDFFEFSSTLRTIANFSGGNTSKAIAQIQSAIRTMQNDSIKQENLVAQRKGYRIQDFYFYVHVLHEITQLPELVQIILKLLHQLRREEAFEEYEKGNHAISAEMLLSTGCEKKDGLVCYRLAHMYQYGKGVEKDRKKSQELYIIALDLLGDSALELFFLGVICKEGLSGNTMIAKAVECYRKSAKMGCPMAQINLGVCYRTGEGVPVDLLRACKYFKRASAQNSALGQCHIGYMYEFGYGVEMDLKEAIRFYKMAASKDHEYAKSRLKEILKQIELNDDTLLQ